MSYKTQCIEAFEEYINEQDWDVLNKEIARQTFVSGFDFGSLNGASENIQEYAVDQLKPIKNKRAREIIEKLRSSKSK